MLADTDVLSGGVNMSHSVLLACKSVAWVQRNDLRLPCHALQVLADALEKFKDVHAFPVVTRPSGDDDDLSGGKVGMLSAVCEWA